MKIKRDTKAYTKGKAERVFYLLERVETDIKEIRATLLMEGFTHTPPEHSELSGEIEASRLKAICRLRHNGLTLTQIGDLFGLSRQRVHQIITEAGVETE